MKNTLVNRRVSERLFQDFSHVVFIHIGTVDLHGLRPDAFHTKTVLFIQGFCADVRTLHRQFQADETVSPGPGVQPVKEFRTDALTAVSFAILET